VETGISKEQIEAWRADFSRLVHRPTGLRLVVVAVVFVLGYFGWVRPQASRLEDARAAEREWDARAQLAEELQLCADRIAACAPRLPQGTDLTDWQTYVAGKLRLSGATLSSIEPHASESAGPFDIVALEIEAEATFAQIVDFIDRVERGERFMRFDLLAVDKRPTHLAVTCVVLGIVRNDA